MAKNVAIYSRDDDEATSRLETSSSCFRLNLSSSSTAARVESSQAEEEQMDACIWSMLPVELVDKILLWLPIPNLFQMRAVCRSWDKRIRSKSFTLTYMKTPSRGPAAWLFMCSCFNCREHTCAYNPLQNKWHNFPLSFLPPCIRFPLTSVGELLFVRGGLNNAGVLAVCNPMTQAWRELPSMIHTRLNSLVGVCCEDTYASSYKIVVAGGMSECGGDYECTTEVYDSLTDSWQVTGKTGRELTVHLTWWTSNTIFCNGVLYCLTSGRPYSIIGYNMNTAVWTEVPAPPPKFLFCSFLIERRGNLMLVGGVGTQRICEHVHIWQLLMQGSTQQWVAVAKMPHEYFLQFSKERNASDLKCVGNVDLVYFFKDSHTQVMVCDFSKEPAEWRWLPTCPLSANFHKFSVRGLFVNPRLDTSI
ncbi:unnamed protein product [Sphagnum compactum]